MGQISVFSIGYSKGIRQALLSFIDLLDIHSDALAYYKVVPKKYNQNIQRLLKSCLENREEFTHYGGDCELYLMKDGKIGIRWMDKESEADGLL